jgi:hypothetical protein
MVLSRGYSVTPLSRSSWSRFFEEYYCRGCGFQEAYCSRPRGFFEKHVLPFFLLQTVRCGRCFHRGYALSTIPALERIQIEPKQSQGQPLGGSESGNRVA